MTVRTLTSLLEIPIQLQLRVHVWFWPTLYTPKHDIDISQCLQQGDDEWHSKCPRFEQCKDANVPGVLVVRVSKTRGFVCRCMFVFVCACAYVRVRVQVCVRTRVCVQMHVCMCLCVRVRVCAYACACACADACVYVFVCACA
jgi:hypothetical protein